MVCTQSYGLSAEKQGSFHYYYLLKVHENGVN